jgi:hypothetical protein
MEICDRIPIHVTVHGFWSTVYIRHMYGLNRIYAVYAGNAKFESQQQQSLLLFLVLFFSRLFLLSSSFASLSYRCMFFALIISFLVVMVVELPFTGKGFFCLFGLKQA